MSERKTGDVPQTAIDQARFEQRRAAERRLAITADKLVDTLFRGGNRERADRLVLMQGKVGHEHELGGWCAGAVRDQILIVLRALDVDLEVERERVARVHDELDELRAIGASEQCGVCGCTNDDCSQCIARTGQACRWVAPNLCSACSDELAQSRPPAPARRLR